MSGRWAGDEDGELWQVEIEHDCFTEGRPFVVSLLVRDYCDGDYRDGEGQSEALATPSADEAREMAAALIAAADNADKANARIARAR